MPGPDVARLVARIRDGRCDLVLDYLAAGGAPDGRDDQGVPLVRWCAYYGDVSALRILVDAGCELALLGDNLDLNGAAFHGHWRLCEYLLAAGANPNACLDTGETPLHATLTKANRLGSELVVQVLLAAGADPNGETVAGAETGGFMRDVRTRGETVLHRAAAYGSERTLRMLLDAGADREARDAAGDSPLSWASWHLRPVVILRLLCFGEHRISDSANWTGDHGAGPHGLERHLLGKPDSG